MNDWKLDLSFVVGWLVSWEIVKFIIICWTAVKIVDFSTKIADSRELKHFLECI